MPHWISLESDHRELRAIVARTRGKALVIEKVLAVPLAEDAASDSAAALSAARVLKQTVTEHRLEKLSAVVALGRTSTELRQMLVPQVPPEELPDLVRLQALRQFTNIGEDWPLDFAPLVAAGGEGINVLAAVIPPTVVKQVQEDTAAASLHVKGLVLRPFAAVSLLRREQPDPGCRMLVDVVNEEADLTVSIADQVAFTRTVRLPAEGDGDGRVKALLGELRRTIVAAQNQLGGQKVEAIVVFGGTAESAQLKAVLDESLGLPVQVIDPFVELTGKAELLCVPPSQTGRFAPLLGMVLDEFHGTPHDIDFIEPKRRPTPPNLLRRNLLIGATAAAVVLAVVGGIYLGLSDLDSQIAFQRGELAKLKKKVPAAQQQEQELKAIQQFADGDISWLDELHKIAERFPPAEKVKVSQLTLSAGVQENLGEIMISGYASESAVVEQLETSLRDGTHRVVAGKLRIEPRDKTHPWEFDTRVFIHAPKPEASSNPASAASKAPGRATAASSSRATKTKAE